MPGPRPLCKLTQSLPHLQSDHRNRRRIIAVEKLFRNVRQDEAILRAKRTRATWCQLDTFQVSSRQKLFRNFISIRNVMSNIGEVFCVKHPKQKTQTEYSIVKCGEVQRVGLYIFFFISRRIMSTFRHSITPCRRPHT